MIIPSQATLNPGDEGPPDAPGVDEDTCRRCHGNGTLDSGEDCPDCGGLGLIQHGIGGG